MPKYTENLNLFKYDVPNDGNRPFDIETSLNENWDKIDTFSQENNLQNKITNCITEIPQRIKLELNNGVLTLKAGSVVTIPNGFEDDGTTPKFDYMTLENDYSNSLSWIDQEIYITFRPSRDIKLDGVIRSNVYSGTTAPSGIIYQVWYDTASNKIKRHNGTSWAEDDLALPLGLVTGNGSISSINQIFQGIGYIGSIVWIDKEVKFLIPNGRNEDGSLKNIEYITTKCTTWITYTGDSYKRTLFRFLENGELGSGIFSVINDIMAERVYIQETPPTIINTQLWYKPSENQYYGVKNGTTWQKVYPAIISLGIQASSDRISSVTFYQPVNLVKKSDSSWLSGLGMPSNRWVNISNSPANNSNWTAPANGYFCVNSYAKNYIALHCGNVRIVDSRNGGSDNTDIAIYVPAKKGQICNISYNPSWEPNSWQTNSKFWFVYAEGN